MSTTLLTRTNMATTGAFDDQTTFHNLARELQSLRLAPQNRLANGLNSNFDSYEENSLYHRDYSSLEHNFLDPSKIMSTQSAQIDLGFDENIFALPSNGVRKSANMTETVPVPSSEHVAEIVGRQGCKIKSLRAKTNTYIKTPVRGEEPVFVVTGRKEDVAHAKKEILSAADHFSQIRASRRSGSSQNSNSGSTSPTSIPGHITKEVRVPYKVVGLVVGPKGATIKRIQQTTSTYIVTPGRDKEPVFEVTGLPENVEKAKEEIEKHIASRTGSDNNADLHIDDFQISTLDSGYDQSSDSSTNTHNFHGFNGILNANDNLPPLSSVVSTASQFAVGSTSQLSQSQCNTGSGAALKISNSYHPFHSSFPTTYNPLTDIDEGLGASGVNIFDPSSIWSDSSLIHPQRSNSLSVHQLPPGDDGPHPRTRRTNSDPLAAALQSHSGLARSPADSAGSLSPVASRKTSSGLSCVMCRQQSNATLFPCHHSRFCLYCAQEICHREPERKCCPICGSVPSYALPNDCIRTSTSN